MQINTLSGMSPLKNRLLAKSQENINNNNFSNLLDQNIAPKKTTQAQTVSSSVPASFELENSSLSNISALTSNSANTSSIASSTTSQAEQTAPLVIDPSDISEKNATSDAVQVKINGDTMTFSVDMSKTDNVSITVKKNDDGSFTFNITDSGDTDGDSTIDNTTDETTDSETSSDPTAPTTPTTNPTTPATTDNSFELFDEEWMIEGHDYSNSDPAYSPVTGNNLNVTMGNFVKMMDRASWDPVTKTHLGTPTGQSWVQFQYMLASGLDPYVTLFY